jgi:hypothetical protein
VGKSQEHMEKLANNGNYGNMTGKYGHICGNMGNS